eukprot:gene26547-biopygen16821
MAQSDQTHAKLILGAPMRPEVAEKM